MRHCAQPIYAAHFTLYMTFETTKHGQTAQDDSSYPLRASAMAMPCWQPFTCCVVEVTGEKGVTRHFLQVLHAAIHAIHVGLHGAHSVCG